MGCGLSSPGAPLAARLSPLFDVSNLLSHCGLSGLTVLSPARVEDYSSVEAAPHTDDENRLDISLPRCVVPSTLVTNASRLGNLPTPLLSPPQIENPLPCIARYPGSVGKGWYCGAVVVGETVPCMHGDFVRCRALPKEVRLSATTPISTYVCGCRYVHT